MNALKAVAIAGGAVAGTVLAVRMIRKRKAKKALEEFHSTVSEMNRQFTQQCEQNHFHNQQVFNQNNGF